MCIEYCWKSEKERDNSEDQDIEGWIILRNILQRCGGVGWIDLA
jgi:hypothetical protein